MTRFRIFGVTITLLVLLIACGHFATVSTPFGTDHGSDSLAAVADDGQPSGGFLVVEDDQDSTRYTLRTLQQSPVQQPVGYRSFPVPVSHISPGGPREIYIISADRQQIWRGEFNSNLSSTTWTQVLGDVYGAGYIQDIASARDGSDFYFVLSTGEVRGGSTWQSVSTSGAFRPSVPRLRIAVDEDGSVFVGDSLSLTSNGQQIVRLTRFSPGVPGPATASWDRVLPYWHLTDIEASSDFVAVASRDNQTTPSGVPYYRIQLFYNATGTMSLDDTFQVLDMFDGAGTMSTVGRTHAGTGAADSCAVGETGALLYASVESQYPSSGEMGRVIAVCP